MVPASYVKMMSVALTADDCDELERMWKKCFPQFTT